MRKKFWIRGTLFVCIAALLLFAISPVFVYRNAATNRIDYMLHSEEKPEVKVGFFGGSHAYNAFAPSVLWENNSIKAYNFSSSGQPIYLTYHFMVELLKTTKLDVAVIDLYYMGSTDEYFNQEDYLRQVIDSTSFSRNKIEMINACISPLRRPLFYFPLVRFHARWNELTEADYGKITYTEENYLLGWGPSDMIHGKDYENYGSCDSSAEIPEKSLTYLYKIIELARENDIELVFTSLPHDQVKDFEAWVEDLRGMMNSVEEIAKDEGIPFIQFMDVLGEMDFDPKADMANRGHVNWSGGYKTSTYIGNYLAENYPELVDKNPTDKAQWDSRAEDLEKYMKSMETKKLS